MSTAITAKKPGRPRTWVSDEPTTHIRVPRSMAKKLMAIAHQAESLAAAGETPVVIGGSQLQERLKASEAIASATSAPIPLLVQALTAALAEIQPLPAPAWVPVEIEIVDGDVPAMPTLEGECESDDLFLHLTDEDLPEPFDDGLGFNGKNSSVWFPEAKVVRWDLMPEDQLDHEFAVQSYFFHNAHEDNVLEAYPSQKAAYLDIREWFFNPDKIDRTSRAQRVWWLDTFWEIYVSSGALDYLDRDDDSELTTTQLAAFEKAQAAIKAEENRGKGFGKKNAKKQKR